MQVRFVPGFSLTPDSWHQVASLLPESVAARALAVSSRGDVRECAAALGREGGRAVYVGYSMGGRLALRLAIDQPSLVNALVLISSTAGIAGHAERRRRMLEEEALADWIDRNGREAFLDRWLALPMYEGLDPVIARRARLDSAAEIAGQLRRLGQGVTPPLWDRLHELRVPVLLIVGERDPKYAGIAAEMLAGIGLHAELEIVPGCAHAIPVEWPGAVASLVGEFVNGLDEASGSG